MTVASEPYERAHLKSPRADEGGVDWDRLFDLEHRPLRRNLRATRADCEVTRFLQCRTCKVGTGGLLLMGWSAADPPYLPLAAHTTAVCARAAGVGVQREGLMWRVGCHVRAEGGRRATASRTSFTVTEETIGGREGPGRPLKRESRPWRPSFSTDYG